MINDDLVLVVHTGRGQLLALLLISRPEFRPSGVCVCVRVLSVVVFGLFRALRL